VDAVWGESYSAGYSLVVRVSANDRSGLLRDITTILANEKVNVLGVPSRSDTRQQLATSNSDIVKGKQWLSTLDTRTTTICIVRDRLQYTLDGKLIGHNVPYLRGPGRAHFCCRSTETLILKSWREMGFDTDEMDAGTRASMDGQTAGDTTYGEWLQRQSYSRQKAVLGTTRAQLLRAGKLKVPDFFNDRGEFITLDQLRELEPRAFE